MCEHGHHIGMSRDAADSRIARISWITNPSERGDAALIMLQEVLGLMHEVDELPWPTRDPIDYANHQDVRIRVANWLCGEGEWRPGSGE